MKRLDKNLVIYISTLILSWIIIIYYLVVYLDKPNDEQIKKELETYPYNHSEIKDTSKNVYKQTTF